MLTLPKGIIHVLRHFEAVFSERVWEWAKVLVIGAILALGERTVAAILRVMGCSNEKQFQNYHRVLNRATWSSRELSRLVLVRLFVPRMEIATGTALWYQSPVPPVAIRWVLIRDPQGQYEPTALRGPDQNADAAQIVEWFVLRWTVEVTIHSVREHLGGETQRQWSDLAILRTTPALLGLFSLVTIFAQQLLEGQAFPVRQAAWYCKALPTFSDTLADLRQHLWPSACFSVSSPDADTVQIPRALFDL